MNGRAASDSRSSDTAVLMVMQTQMRVMLRMLSRLVRRAGHKHAGVGGSGPLVRIGRVLHTSMSRFRYAHGGGFAGSEV
jgi:hypothetical protein